MGKGIIQHITACKKKSLRWGKTEGMISGKPWFSYLLLCSIWSRNLVVEDTLILSFCWLLSLSPRPSAAVKVSLEPQSSQGSVGTGFASKFTHGCGWGSIPCDWMESYCLISCWLEAPSLPHGAVTTSVFIKVNKGKREHEKDEVTEFTTQSWWGGKLVL